MRLLKFWKLRVGTYSSWALNRSGGANKFSQFSAFYFAEQSSILTISNIKKTKVSTESLGRTYSISISLSVTSFLGRGW